MDDHFEGGAGAFGVEEVVVGWGAGGDVLGLEEGGLGVVEGFSEAEVAGPGAVVGEVDVGGEVLAADVLVEGGAFDAVLHEVAAEGAARAAMVEGGEGVAVVDGEHLAGFPMGDPGGEPVVDGGVDFDALAGGEGVWGDGEGFAVAEFLGGGAVWGGVDPDFLPLGAGPLQEAAGEGVEEFVVVDEGVAVGGLKGVFEAGVPADGGSEEGLLLGF